MDVPCTAAAAAADDDDDDDDAVWLCSDGQPGDSIGLLPDGPCVA